MAPSTPAPASAVRRAASLIGFALLSACSGGGSPSAPPPPPPPTLAVPATLVAVATGPSTISVSWAPVATATGYELQRGASPSGPFSALGNPGAAVTTYDDTGLVTGASWSYQVRATGPGGPSVWSPAASATTLAAPATAPAAPSGLLAAAGADGVVALTWTDNSSNESGFEVERSPSAIGPYARVTTAPAGATSFTDTGLASLATYFYRVRAVNGAGASPWSAIASAQSGGPPVPAVPTGLTAAQAGDGSIKVTWTAVTGATGYELQTALGTGRGLTWGATIAIPASATSYIDNPPTLSTANYQLRAVNVAGASAWAGTQVYVGAVLIVLPCWAPTIPSAAATSQTSIHLAWTKSANCGFTVVERAPASTGPWSQIAVVGDILSIPPAPPIIGDHMDDTGLQPATTSWYRLKAIAGGQTDSPYTTPFSATTPTSLVAPGGLVITATSATTAHLTWTYSPAGQDGFALEYASAASGPFAELSRVGASVTSADVQGLTPGVPAWFQVRAYRGTELSAPSAAVSVTPSGPTTLVASADVEIMQSNGDPNLQNQRSTTDPNNVGCFYYWIAGVSGPLGPWANCTYSLLQFDTSALTGHTIRSAALRLTICGLAPAPAGANYAVFALAGAWNPATVTFNTVPQMRGTDGWANPAPTAGGIVDWDVTAMVQKWASGTWANDGIVLMPYQPVAPVSVPSSGSLDQTTAFCSLESAAGHPAWAPVLVVDYQ